MVSILYLVRNITKGLDIGWVDVIVFNVQKTRVCECRSSLWTRRLAKRVWSMQPPPPRLTVASGDCRLTTSKGQSVSVSSIFLNIQRTHPPTCTSFVAIPVTDKGALSPAQIRSDEFFFLFCFSRSLIAMRAHTCVWRRSSGEFHGPGGLPLPSIAVEEWWHHFHSPWSDRSARWQNNRLLTPAAKGRSCWQAF